LFEALFGHSPFGTSAVIVGYFDIVASITDVVCIEIPNGRELTTGMQR
jgi:hypothetical protein